MKNFKEFVSESYGTIAAAAGRGIMQVAKNPAARQAALELGTMALKKGMEKLKNKKQLPNNKGETEVVENYQKPKVLAKPIEPFQTQLQKAKKEYEPYRKMYEKMFGSKKKEEK